MLLPDLSMKTLSPEEAMQKCKVFQERRRNAKGLHILFKFPILAIILLIIAFDMLCYFLLRIFIFLSERLLTSSKRSQLLYKARMAKHYEEWKEYNSKLDVLEGNEEWKEFPESSYYNQDIIKANLKRLNHILSTSLSPQHKMAQKQIDLDDIKFIERCCIPNVGGIGNYHMYTNCRVGTKKVTHEYVKSLDKVVKAICSEDSSLSSKERQQFIENVERSYGRTALILSGGATFGFYHWGVVKALLEQNILPSVISGTSAGSLLAALVCVQKNEDILELISPDAYTFCKVFLNWFEMVKNYIKNGSMRDNEDYRQMAEDFMRSDIKDITFMEAFQKTGKVLNISCSVDGNKVYPGRQLNYITAPNCIISSAVVASAAVPVLLRPQPLLYKEADGCIKKRESESFVWRDGGFKNDLPMKELGAAFNVNNFIVSQVNPHILPFFFWNSGSPGKPTSRNWRGGFCLSYMEAYLKLDMKKWANLINQMEIFPELFGHDLTELFLQETFGEITIAPSPNLMNYLQFLSNVDSKRLEKYIQSGCYYTWPNISMINNTYLLEKTIRECKKELNCNHHEMIDTSVIGKRKHGDS